MARRPRAGNQRALTRLFSGWGVRTGDVNLHVTLLDKLGVHVEKFGDSTGKLENLGVKTLPGI